MKPSERISELANKAWKKGIDPEFSGAPSVTDYIGAIISYIDEESVDPEEKK